jgi:hypothetical protein
MPVHITEISIEGLHPQPALHLLPRRVNLIYGRNEFGKTRLVEFLLRSLFHSSNKMVLRPGEVIGRVKINGLQTKSETWFTPASRDKLEDHLAMQNKNLPPELARLLVVKGAESELQSGQSGGLGRAALNEYISNQSLIDRISDRVPKNTRQAQVQDGLIVGGSTGDLKRRKEILDRISVIDHLFSNIDQQASGGPMAELTANLVELETSAAALRTARQHYVNQLAAEQTQLRIQSDLFPYQEIQQLESDIRDEAHYSEGLSRARSDLKTKELILEHYNWLEAALQTYQITTVSTDIESQWILPGLAVSSVIGSVVFAFLDIPWVAAIFAGIALILGFFTYRQIRTVGRITAAAPENQRIAVEFERRFGMQFNGLIDLQARKTALERDFNLVQNLSELIQSTSQRLYEVTSKIDGRLSQWVDVITPSQIDRQSVLKKLHEKRQSLDTALMQLEIDLKTCPVAPIAGGEVTEADFFDPQKLADLESKITGIHEQISSLKQQMVVLKQRICDLTGDSISKDLTDLILSLQDHRLEQEQTCRTITAEILAGIAVTQAMQELRAGEDAALQTALQSVLIRNSLSAVTGRYNRIDLIGDDLSVSDDFQTFKLSELSTGAQEQVLLGVRIGLASRLFSGQPLFLILDDAFQHSDWQRRPGMVDEILRLAETGWQIFYLTMDDHLRDLFLEKTPKILKDDFQFISLTG